MAMEGGHWLPTSISWDTLLLADFRKARKGLMVQDGVSIKQKEINWEPPAQSMLKLNTGACVNEKRNKYSIGGVLRDRQGRLLLVSGKQINPPISVVYGELLAILEGVKLVYEKHFIDVQVATDSLLAVQVVTATEKDLGYLGVCV
ncbi:uncharacterized protein [Henckelia pumila]|uniref:uncharacterized protein n=1 Tax=Henckelia pumila TaxID=405737 RepID=UPI003C6DF4E0